MYASRVLIPRRRWVGFSFVVTLISLNNRAEHTASVGISVGAIGHRKGDQCRILARRLHVDTYYVCVGCKVCGQEREGGKWDQYLVNELLERKWQETTTNIYEVSL